jgi:hypothetical protein
MGGYIDSLVPGGYGDIERKTELPSVSSLTGKLFESGGVNGGDRGGNNNGTSTSAAATGGSAEQTENILNNYKSVNYNFTFAALPPDALNDPSSYRDTKLKYVVASSKGKGENAISSDVVSIKASDGGSNDTVIDTATGKAIVEEFNKKSPGAFDLFINSVELESIVAPNEATGVSLSTKVGFEIFEPLSANGFIEALHVSAIAAGWSGYLGCCYLLKIEFLGYPDSVNGPTDKHEVIKATKYIPLKLVGTEMEVTETGTKYRVKGIPYNEASYATPNKLFTEISFKGNTVKVVLENLIAAVNASTRERAIKEKGEDKASQMDDYEIYFPVYPEPGKSLTLDKTGKVNDMGGSEIRDVLRSNTLFAFPPIEKSPNATPVGYSPSKDSQAANVVADDRYVPTTQQIQFAKDSNISEIIEAVIRDSEYVKGILKDVNAAISKGGNGMIDYFQVLINSVPKTLDTTNNVHLFTYQYIVVPHKVHYSKLPGQQNSKHDIKTMLPYVKRTYDYLYQGKNVDVLSFKLNFNNLFFQAAVPKSGNTDKSGTKDSAGASNDEVVKSKTGQAAGASKSQLDSAPIRVDNESGFINGSGGPQQTSPYFQLAKNAHRAILESVNLLTGDLEILGDPFFLSTSGMGNYMPKAKSPGMTADGESSPNIGPVIVRLNFRNPVDIDYTTGLVTFSELTPFSGLYQVLKCKNTFRDGVFKQHLSIMRYNGQIDASSKDKATKPIQQDEGQKPGDKQRVDSAPKDVSKSGAPANDVNLTNILSKGDPRAADMLKKATSALQTALPIAGIAGLLTGKMPSLPGIAALTGVVAAAQSGAFSELGKIAGSVIPGAPGALLNSNVASSISSMAGPLANVAGTVTAGIPTLDKIISGASTDAASAISGTASVAGSVNNALSAGKGLLSDAVSAAQSAGGAAALVGGIGNKLDNLKAGAAAGIGDLSPEAIAAKLGIDTKAVSGLTGMSSGLVDKVKELAKSVPPNVNLTEIKKAGVLMENLAADTLKNIPAIPPKLAALAAALPARSLSSALSPEQRAAVIADASEKGIPVDQALRNASMFGINVPGLSDEAKKIALSLNPQSLTGGLGSSISGLAAGLGASAAGLGLKVPSISGLSAAASGLGLKVPSVGASFGADALAGKLSTVQSGLTGLIPSGASVEGSIAGIQNALGNPGSAVTQLGNLSNSVTAKFGSLSGSAASPLEKLMNNAVNSLNDPNAPPYTGDDPIIRRRLGLPPIDTGETTDSSNSLI